METKQETLELCPRCGRNRYTRRAARASDVGTAQIHEYPYPALSRVDNATDICSPCGQDEAMRDWQQLPPIPPDRWPIAESGFKEVNQ